MQYETEIRKFIVDKFLLGDDTRLKPDDSMMGTGTMDSTGVLELISFLENTYHIKVNDDELLPENLDSISSICAFLRKKHGQ